MRNLNKSRSADDGAPAPASVAPIAPPQGVRRRSGARDGLVLLSIAIVSVAIATMAYAQFGVSFGGALIAGAIAWAGFMLAHKLVQKSMQVAQLKAELARVRGAGRPKTAQRGAPPSPLETAAVTTIDTRAPDASAAIPELDIARPVMAGPAMRGPDGSRAEADVRLPPDFPNLAAGHGPRSDAPPLLGVEPSLSFEPPRAPLGTMSPVVPPLTEPDAAETPLPAVDPLRDQWSFRPRNEPRSSGEGASFERGPENTRPALTIDSDLENVQRKIRELADDAGSSDILRSTPQVQPQAAKSKSDALEDSIGALKAAATTMRERNLSSYIPALDLAAAPRAPIAATEPGKTLGEFVIPATAKSIAAADESVKQTTSTFQRREPVLPELPRIELPPVQPVEPRGDGLVRAIEADNIGVKLAPIVTLSSHSVGHYEMIATAVTPAGEPIEGSEDDLGRLGVDIATRLDISRLKRASALVVRMENREKDGALLTAFMGSSFTSRPFLESLAGSYEAQPRIASQLVPVLTQRSVSLFPQNAWQAVRDMHAFGFRFAMDGVTDLDADFAAAALAGFRFVRLDARLLVQGTTAGNRFQTGEEIRQRMARAGLMVIATSVDDALLQRQLLDAGVLLGQGPLFGEARPVKVESESGSERSAA